MIAAEPRRASYWVIAGCRYLIVILGLYLIVKLAAGLIALGVIDLGLTATSLTWLGVGILGVDLVLILYLVFSLLMNKRRRSSAGLYMAPLVLCITVAITLWTSQRIGDCTAADAFVVCAATGLVWQILGFAIGGFGILQIRNSGSAQKPAR